MGFGLMFTASFPTFADATGVGHGGGGDVFVYEFQNVAGKVLEQLRQQAIPGVNADDLTEIIAKARVSSQERVFLNGSEVDAANYPDNDPPLIYVSREAWTRNASEPYLRAVLVLHEYLGLRRVDDVNFNISRGLDPILGSWYFPGSMTSPFTNVQVGDLFHCRARLVEKNGNTIYAFPQTGQIVTRNVPCGGPEGSPTGPLCIDESVNLGVALSGEERGQDFGYSLSVKSSRTVGLEFPEDEIPEEGPNGNGRPGPLVRFSVFQAIPGSPNVRKREIKLYGGTDFSKPFSLELPITNSVAYPDIVGVVVTCGGERP